MEQRGLRAENASAKKEPLICPQFNELTEAAVLQMSNGDGNSEVVIAL